MALAALGSEVADGAITDNATTAGDGQTSTVSWALTVSMLIISFLLGWLLRGAFERMRRRKKEAREKEQAKVGVMIAHEIFMTEGGTKFHISPTCHGLSKRTGELKQRQMCLHCMRLIDKIK